MRDYYDLFICLSKRQCLSTDYTDKKKIEEHNTSAKKIWQLKDEMKSQGCLSVLDPLLEHDDDRVKINAAALCLELDVFQDKAKIVLEQIYKCSGDSTLSFSAKMLLNKIKE